MADRGYMNYNPTGLNEHWLRCAQAVVQDYEDNWPLTVRQVFYRMVASYQYPKKEEDYKKLVKIMARARRASLIQPENSIPFKAIRDDRGREEKPWEFESQEEFLDYLIKITGEFQLVRTEGQPKHVELWCEAAGMVPIIKDIAEPFGLRVSSGGGYDSVTAKHKLASRAVERWTKHNIGTHVLHVGDFDPSGENLCDVLQEDVLMMVAQRSPARREGAKMLYDFEDAFYVERVALTADQVIERGVETAPPKPSDSRMAKFVEKYEWVAEELGSNEISAQLEALRPDELTTLIEDAIVAHLDQDAFDQVTTKESAIARSLKRQLSDWRDSRRGNDGDED